jgi:glycerol-3-phosphate dehydrogenase
LPDGGLRCLFVFGRYEMWMQNWREEIWSNLAEKGQVWDLLVIGGGITGAGILREATRLGLKVLLVDQKDFAWGTSSRSSKLVHGGFRYLKEGKLKLTKRSVREREHLVHEAPGLIDPLGFLMTLYKGDFPGRLTMKFGLTIYDLLALRWDHQYYSPQDFRMLAPHATGKELECGFRYGDAQTDDARLVLRLIREAVRAGGKAINYVRAEELVQPSGDGAEQDAIYGVRIRDMVGNRELVLQARVVINATGAWADRLRATIGERPRIRPLRGSHLVFPGWRLPAAQALTLWHPVDRRPVFIFPWEGITLVGTTDVDHRRELDEEPRISPYEVAYLMAAVEAQFPSQEVSLQDVISTFAGVRPVIGSGKENPSKEARDHAIWMENGLLTVTGGKLTTFRLIALDVLKTVRSRLPEMPPPDSRTPVLDPVEVSFVKEVLDKNGEDREIRSLGEDARRRLLGRYGTDAASLLACARPGELVAVPGTEVLWAELRWAARAEGVIHLHDLLLRRVRLGILLPEGGKDHLPQIRRICQEELSWDDPRWEAEEESYLKLWKDSYSLPDPASVPDWKEMLEAAREIRLIERPARRQKLIGSSILASFIVAAAAALGFRFFKKLRRKMES